MCVCVCVHHFEQLSYTTQHRAVLLISLLSSREAAELRCCLLEGRGGYSSEEMVQIIEKGSETMAGKLVKEVGFKSRVKEWRTSRW